MMDFKNRRTPLWQMVLISLSIHCAVLLILLYTFPKKPADPAKIIPISVVFETPAPDPVSPPVATRPVAKQVDKTPPKKPIVKQNIASSKAAPVQKQVQTSALPPSPTPTIQKGTAEKTGAVYDYFTHVQAHLEKHKNYPRRARMQNMEGKVVITVTIDRSGNMLSRHLIESSNYPTLDKAAFETLTTANPLPPLPESIPQSTLTLDIPFAYALND
jgi:protein TonB